MHWKLRPVSTQRGFPLLLLWARSTALTRKQVNVPVPGRSAVLHELREGNEKHVTSFQCLHVHQHRMRLRSLQVRNLVIQQVTHSTARRQGCSGDISSLGPVPRVLGEMCQQLGLDSLTHPLSLLAFCPVRGDLALAVYSGIPFPRS